MQGPSSPLLFDDPVSIEDDATVSIEDDATVQQAIYQSIEDDATFQQAIYQSMVADAEIDGIDPGDTLLENIPVGRM